MKTQTRVSPEVGSTQVCAETGLPFVIASEGDTFNYATNAAGEIFSDAGVDARERRELLDRTKPFFCYLSSDGRSVTGWKGNVLGRATHEGKSSTGWHASSITHIRVTDCHGGMWHGKGAGRGMCITLRSCK